MALGYFDRLLRMLTDEELKAVDGFVAENPSFTVFTNLSRRVEPRLSSLSDHGKAKYGESHERTHARRGLAWVMALARVEYASILAGFTTTPNPFVAVRPSKYELPAYKELLLDGARMHYWSLSNNPSLKKLTRISPGNPMVLSYSRRMGLARKMLTAVATAGIGEMSPHQYRELASWKRDLDSLHVGLLTVIQAYLTMEQQHSSATSTTKEEREFVQACGAQLRGEAAELKAGTARVFNLAP